MTDKSVKPFVFLFSLFVFLFFDASTTGFVRLPQTGALFFSCLVERDRIVRLHVQTIQTLDAGRL